MRKSEHIGLNTFEQTDRLSMGAFNENWGMLDVLLGDLVARRARIASGSYVGQTASNADSYTDRKGKVLVTGFGLPVSTTSDKVIAQMDFEPKVILLMGSRATSYAWSGTLLEGDAEVSRAKSGQERQSFFMVGGPGMELCPVLFSQRGPCIVTDSSVELEPTFVWAFRDGQKDPVCVNAYGDASTFEFLTEQNRYPWLLRTAQVVTEEVAGTYTVTVKGASTVLGTENLTDIQGLTYHWVALG